MPLIGLLIGFAGARLEVAEAAHDAGGDAALLMTSLVGRWSCQGAFANGRPLRARLEFARDLGGEGLRFHHSDLPPTKFVADALWSLDKGSGQMVSLAWTGMQGASGRSAAMYVSDQLSASSARLVQRPLLTRPFAPNRFTYSVTGGQLTMTWEVERGGQWKVGDFLHCAVEPSR